MSPEEQFKQGVITATEMLYQVCHEEQIPVMIRHELDVFIVGEMPLARVELYRDPQGVAQNLRRRVV